MSVVRQFETTGGLMSRRNAVTWAIEEGDIPNAARAIWWTSRACLPHRYRSSRRDDAGVRKWLHELAAERGRFGYRRLHLLLKREGVEVNRKSASTRRSG